MGWVTVNGVDRQPVPVDPFDVVTLRSVVFDSMMSQRYILYEQKPRRSQLLFSHFSIVIRIRGDCRTGPTGCFVEMNVLTQGVRGCGNGSNDVSIDSSAN